MLTHTSQNGRFSIQVDDSNQRTAFEAVASFHEVFEDEPCGCCGGNNIKFQVRNVQDGKKTFTYYEKVCRNLDCRARLAMGCHQENNTLFPKRYSKDGEKSVMIGKYGWTKFNKETGKEE